MTSIYELAKALIKLKNVTQSYVSKESGVQKGNLSIWLQGNRKLSEQAEVNILKVLGVSAGMLDDGIVHCWTTGNKLDNLNFVLKVLCPKPQLQPLMPDNHNKITHLPLTAITNSSRLKIIVKLKPTLEESMGGNKATISKQTIDDSRWYIDKQPRAIASLVYDCWQEGKASIDEFDEYISPDIAYTWMDVLDVAEDNGISPAEVMVALKDMVKNKLIST